MNFDNLNSKELKNQLTYFNNYYGDTFRKNQGTEELLDMINKYSLDGTLIDFGSGSNIFFWLLAFNKIDKAFCVDISKEAFYVNEMIKNGELQGKSFDYPIKKYGKKLFDVTNTEIEYCVKDMLNGKSTFEKKADNVSQFGLLGLNKCEKDYYNSFKKLYSSLKENGVFLGANWIFSDIYAKKKKFKNDYITEEMIYKISKRLNGECLYVKKLKINYDINYDYVIIYAIKKNRMFSMLDLQKMRLYNNGISKKFIDTNNCVYSLIGIQSQYQNYALISLFNRVLDLRIEQIINNRSLIKSWGQRTTLHIFHKKDYNLISDIYVNKDNWIKKKAKKLNINLDYYINLFNNYLMEYDIALKSDFDILLQGSSPKQLMQWSGLLIEASYQKVLYGILNNFDQKIYKKNDIKYSKINEYDFLERYFKYYGPATISDFLHWSGLNKNDLKDYIDLFIKKNEYIEIEDEKYYYVDKIPEINKKKENDYYILGKFDPLLVGYKNKKWILGDNKSNIIWKKAGQIEGIILDNNGIVATWHYTQNIDKIKFIVKIISQLSSINYAKIEYKFKLISEFLNKNQYDIKYV